MFREQLRYSTLLGITIGASLLTWVPAQARVTRIIIDQADKTTLATGQDILYQTLTERAFGELDPRDPHNVLITDIGLAPTNARGKVEYIATFFIVMPESAIPDREGPLSPPRRAFRP